MDFKKHEIEQWEDGDLGASADSVRVSTNTESLDDALEMQLISIRLQKKLIADLKRVAGHYGLGYQPMIRDLLTRFANAELKMMLNAELRQLEQAEAKIESTEPVTQFMNGRKQA